MKSLFYEPPRGRTPHLPTQPQSVSHRPALPGTETYFTKTYFTKTYFMKTYFMSPREAGHHIYTPSHGQSVIGHPLPCQRFCIPLSARSSSFFPLISALVVILSPYQRAHRPGPGIIRSNDQFTPWGGSAPPTPGTAEPGIIKLNDNSNRREPPNRALVGPMTNSNHGGAPPPQPPGTAELGIITSNDDSNRP